MCNNPLIAHDASAVDVAGYGEWSPGPSSGLLGAGVATTSDTGNVLAAGEARGKDNVAVLAVKNEPRPPHTELAADVGFFSIGESSKEGSGEDGRNESCRNWDGGGLAEELAGNSFISASPLLISMGGVPGLDMGLPPFRSSFREAELALALRVQRLTPSIAFRKFVEPTLSDRVIASRVGASCWSNLKSWRPSW
jgi:hypothetical protein